MHTYEKDYKNIILFWESFDLVKFLIIFIFLTCTLSLMGDCACLLKYSFSSCFSYPKVQLENTKKNFLSFHYFYLHLYIYCIYLLVIHFPFSNQKSSFFNSFYFRINKSQAFAKTSAAFSISSWV